MDHGGLMASVVLNEPSLGLSPVLVPEIFRSPMSALGHKRERRPRRRPASHAAGVPQLADSLLAGREGSALGQMRTNPSASGAFFESRCNPVPTQPGSG